jgi:hypothetical protein
VIACPRCGAMNKPGSRYCGECGQPLGTPKAITCPLCDTSNPPGITVCTACGADLIPPGVSPSEIVARPPQNEAGSLGLREPERAAGEEEEAGVEETGKDLEPPWLKKLEGIHPAGPGQSPREETQLEKGELPEWLEVPSEFEDMLGQASASESKDDAEPGEIPSWLEALRPEELEGMVEPQEPSEPSGSTGLLKGIAGALGIDPMLAIPRQASPTTAMAPPGVAYERAELFSQVVREPAAGEKLVAPRRAERLAASSTRWVTYLVLAAVVVVPLLLGSRWSVEYMASAPAATAMYEAIEGLPPGSVALVSHDYDPGVAGEMVPQVRAVLAHLMRRGVRVVSVSLTPEGSRLSQQLLAELARDHGYVYGQDYVSLGYVVGVEAGPRSVVEGLVGAHWTDLIADVQDIALVVDFAGAPEYLRLWLEQAQAPYGLPMVAGVSGTADPFARPYYRNQAQRQLLGLVTGLVGAAEYERLSGQPGVALAGMDSQSMGHLAVVLLIVTGNVAYFSQRLKGKLSP